MRNLVVNEKYNNKKLINFLQDSFPGLSQSTIYKTLRKKDIRINDKRVSENCTLQAGDDVKVFIADDLLYAQKNVPIVFEDNNIVVFDKPIGLEVTGDNSLSSYAKQKYNSFVEPCHRLDRNTSGLVLFAKNEESLNILLDAFKHHLVEKHYAALVYGLPKKKSERLEAYLFKDSKKALVYISDKQLPGYQKIITCYMLLKNNSKRKASLLDVTIETGRTHQIRAHLAHINLPIIGDGKYGINSVNKDFKQKTQLLSSYSLGFNLPSDSKLAYLNKLTISKDQVPYIDLI